MRIPPFLRAIPVLTLLWAATASGQLVRQAATTLSLPADLPSATGYSVENALGTLTFSRPLAIRTPPGETTRIFIVEKETGRIMVVPNVSSNIANPPTAKQVFLDLPALLGAGVLQPGTNLSSEEGLLSLAFHPDFNSPGVDNKPGRGVFFISYSLQVASNRHLRVARFKMADPSVNTLTSADLATHQPLITQRDEASNHNGSDLHFGPDGYLYYSTGDEGGANDNWDNARFIDKDFFSAMLRIDVDKRSGNFEPNPHPAIALDGTGKAYYSVPADNPFVTDPPATFVGLSVNQTKLRTEFWATGFRNPWRFSFDPSTGRLFVGDVGQGAREEIDIVTRGGNYGWSLYEGTLNGPRFINPPPSDSTFIPPIHEYPRGDGYSITGGVVYRGMRFNELLGAYLFADYGSQTIWALRQSGATWTRSTIAAGGNIAGIGTDPRNGDILFADIGSGVIKRLVRSGTTGTPPPALLSQTGAFTAPVSSLTPAPGFVPYEPNVAFWSDYAQKLRWFAIKNLTDRVQFSVDGNWVFPTGMVWVKHFDIETTRGVPASRRKLETRLLVKTASDIYGLSYKWRADGTDAELVTEDGLSEAIGGSSPAQTWRYPSRSECRICHTPQGGYALSFNTWQLNRPYEHGMQTPNQITALSDAGYFQAPATNVATLPAFAAAGNTSQSLEWRVRSYLAVNCIQCHQPGGASLGNWDARPTTPTDAAGLINGLLVNHGGNPANRFVVPGQTGLSMLLLRLRGEGIPRMPPLATTERDLEAEALITSWITQDLPNRQNFEEWRISRFGASPGAGTGAGEDWDGDAQTNQLEFLARTDPKIPAPPLTPTVQQIGGNTQLTFSLVPNRSHLIETSVNLIDWTLWNVPGNTPDYPSSAQPRILVAPTETDIPRRFFRLRLTAP